MKLERVNAPKQARSEKRLQDIIQALEKLLDGRAFEEITIPDIAALAGCVPASIYARFKDKNSILVALHESIRDRQIAQIDETMRMERHENLTLDESVLAIFRSLARYYSRNRNLLRPSYLLGDDEIYQRASASMRHASERLAAIVRQKSKSPVTDLDRRVDLAVRAAYGLLQQRMVFQQQAPGRYQPADDDEMAAELALLFRRTLARDG
ncbi:MAG: TetR/AcrR family transcriptional regulator [Bradyrhizobium sp.]|nr:TetR/AcrR family transcriptional regulator [Bradyrhizobium sp.]